MRKVNLLAIFTVVLVIIALTIGAFIVLGNNESNNSSDLLDCENFAQVKNFIEKNKIETYGFKTNYCYINSIKLLGQDADIEFSFNNEQVSAMNVYYTLFLPSMEISDDNEDVEYEVYEFTEADIKDFSDKFYIIKKQLGEKLGCELVQYDLIPTQNDVEIKDDDDLFYQGLLIREYSLRDKSGQLWLLRYEASYGMANATLIKVIDESGYEGFVPSIDMTK